MRIIRTGLALSLALAIGCRRSEPQPAAPAPSPPAPAPAVQPTAVPLDWLSILPRFKFESKLEADPAPLRPRAPRAKADVDPASAISALVAANGGHLPETGDEFARALKAAGDFVNLPVSFSSVALDSGLAKPRIVYTGRGESGPGEAARPSFSGRLFLAANITDSDQPYLPPRLSSIEFISWNSRRLKFDFGVIELGGPEPELRMLDGVRCFTCHKNHGPILGVSPWSNTMHNPPMVEAAAQRLGSSSSVSGLPLNQIDAEEVDRSVRAAAASLQDRRTVQALAKSPGGRAALIRLLGQIAYPPPGGAFDDRTLKLFEQSDFRQFMTEVKTIHRTAVPSELIDIEPQSLMGRVAKDVTWWNQVKPPLLLDYDDLRAGGTHRMSERHFPSNPKAFVRSYRPEPKTAAEALTPATIARAVGLTPGDRRFLGEVLEDAARTASKYNSWPVMPRDLAERAFATKDVMQMLEAGVIPDRDEYKDRFMAGLGDALRSFDYSGKYWLPRERYSSMPRLAAGVDREETAALPTTACLGCHDVAKPGEKRAFNVIPALPFDPFDKSGREAWSKTKDPRAKETLARLLKRLQKDMPPSDSAEHELFRQKNPEVFREAAEFLERELGRR